jgi:hypothetical protein
MRPGAVSSTPNVVAGKEHTLTNLDISAIMFESAVKGISSCQPLLHEISSPDNVIWIPEDQEIDHMTARAAQLYYLVAKLNQQYMLNTKTIKRYVYSLWTEKEKSRTISTELQTCLQDTLFQMRKSSFLEDEILGGAVFRLSTYLEEYKVMSIAVDFCRHKIKATKCSYCLNELFCEELEECLSIVELILTQLLLEKRKALFRKGTKIACWYGATSRMQCTISNLWEVMEELKHHQAIFSNIFLYLRNITASRS